MTNKPMLSVERLLTEIRQSCELSKSRDAQIDAALVELRALLDKPARPAPECVGDLERFEADDGIFVRLGDVIDMLGNEKAAQHQGEPVALVDERAAYEGWQWRRDWPIEALAGTTRSECFKRSFLNPEKYQTIRFNDGLAVWLARAAIPVQPAPVAVVMPERIQGYPAQSNHRSYNDGWNACLTKVARLNGVKS